MCGQAQAQPKATVVALKLGPMQVISSRDLFYPRNLNYDASVLLIIVVVAVVVVIAVVVVDPTNLPLKFG